MRRCAPPRPATLRIGKSQANEVQADQRLAHTRNAWSLWGLSARRNGVASPEGRQPADGAALKMLDARRNDLMRWRTERTARGASRASMALALGILTLGVVD